MVAVALDPKPGWEVRSYLPVFTIIILVLIVSILMVCIIEGP